MNATDTDTDARMRTITATEIIADLMREGLPLVTWEVAAEHGDDSAQFPTLIGVCHSKIGRADVVRAYGERFGVEPHDPHGNGRYLDVVAELRGLHVRVWARMDSTR